MQQYKAEDILIIGAGPAGASASLWFAKQQFPHTIVDKAVFPRDKVCGDAISGKVFSILKQYEEDMAAQLAERQAEALITFGVTFGAPNGEELTLEFNKFAQKTEGREENPTPGFVIKRQDFDNFLFEKINPKYATIHQGTTVKEIAREDGGQIVVQLKQGNKEWEMRPKVVIAADGERSVVNKKLVEHRNSDKHFAGAVRAYYTGVTGFDELNSIELHYIKELLPGYIWFFPLPNGGCNVGMGMLSSHIKSGKRNLRKEMLEVLETHPKFKDRFKNAKLEGKVMGWGLPLGSKKREISGDNLILTGDAASLIDPFTGEGVGNAVISGKYAAVYAIEAMQTGDFSKEFFQARYDKMIYDKLWRELQISHTLQRIGAYPWLVNTIFKFAKSSKNIQDTFAMMFVDIDLRKQLKNPMFYFKMLLGR